MVQIRFHSGAVNRSQTTHLFHPHRKSTLTDGASVVSHNNMVIRCASSKDGREENEEEKKDGRSFGKALGDEVKNFFDFANWAPRSSQAWRLGGLDSTSMSSSDDEEGITEESVEVLNERLAEQRQSMSGSLYMDEDDADDAGSNEPSFLKSTDEEFAESLNARITEVATGSDGMSDEGDEYLGLDGETLLALIEAKYGKKHDVAFVRRDIPGKTLVSLNIYHAYLGQKSFPMSEEDFKEKMDGVALSLLMWDQVETVVAFLKSPVRSQRGLPSRPIVGNAVSISLELTREQIMEWWGR